MEGAVSFGERSVETEPRRKTGLSRLKAGTNDGPIGIGLGWNPVLNLVRLNQGGLSNVAAKKFQIRSHRQSDVHLFTERKENFNLFRRLLVDRKADI